VISLRSGSTASTTARVPLATPSGRLFLSVMTRSPALTSQFVPRPLQIPRRFRSRRAGFLWVFILGLPWIESGIGHLTWEKIENARSNRQAFRAYYLLSGRILLPWSHADSLLNPSIYLVVAW
jgi:hypothetical protein